jgi:hypothetical protein
MEKKISKQAYSSLSNLGRRKILHGMPYENPK